MNDQNVSHFVSIKKKKFVYTLEYYTCVYWGVWLGAMQFTDKIFGGNIDGLWAIINSII